MTLKKEKGQSEDKKHARIKKGIFFFNSKSTENITARRHSEEKKEKIM